jgi:lipoyl(octanoyl) transferase
MPQDWSLINYSKCNGYANMAIDEALFDSLRSAYRPGSGGILRFYEFLMPTVTVGRYQRIKDFPAGTFGEGYDIVRRITGGGLVDHEESLTFAFISHQDASAKFATAALFYKTLHAVIFRAFLDCGIRLVMQRGEAGDGAGFEECFKRPVEYDLLFEGTKVVGGAQKRSKGFILHQSSIFFGVQAWQGRPYLQDLVRNMIIKQFEDAFDIRFEPRCLTAEETQAAIRVEQTKYRTTAWRDKY